MVQSPSWEANWSAASQETPRISRKPKFHYRTHKPPPPVPILGQPNPVHIHTFPSWRSVLILSVHLRLGLPSGSFLPVSPPRPYTPPLLTHMPHMPSPSHSSRFYHPHNIGWGVLVMPFSLKHEYHRAFQSAVHCQRIGFGMLIFRNKIVSRRTLFLFASVSLDAFC